MICVFSQIIQEIIENWNTFPLTEKESQHRKQTVFSHSGKQARDEKTLTERATDERAEPKRNTKSGVPYFTGF